MLTTLQPASLWRRLFRLRTHESATKQLVPWGFRYGRFAGGWQLYKRIIESSSVTLVSIESTPAPFRGRTARKAHRTNLGESGI